jgi:hypothetical protein
MGVRSQAILNLAKKRENRYGHSSFHLLTSGNTLRTIKGVPPRAAAAMAA